MKVLVYCHFNDVVNKVTNSTRYFTTCKIMTRIQRALMAYGSLCTVVLQVLQLLHNGTL